MTWGQHVLPMLYDITLFQNLLLHSPKSRNQSCDYAINLWLMWQCDRQTLTWAVSKNRKGKRKRKDNKLKEKNKKMKSTINDLDNVILSEPSMFFYVTCDLWLCHLMWLHDFVTLTLTLSSKNRKIENKSKKMKIEIK